MNSIFPDWRADGLTTVLHEHRGGFGFNQESMHGIANKARGEGVRILGGVEVLDFDMNNGAVITNEPWGIYFKQDRHGVQGGAVPENFGHEAQVDPYGTQSPYYVVDEKFIDYWTSSLAFCLERFERAYKSYKHEPSGGIGCFTVDNFPVFDQMLPNVYIIADSNHGYKMIGVGKEVAKVVMGEQSSVLYPFRFSRYAEGDLHPTSNSPFPWM